jgi:glycosyltransferase involved in cell wall biosynthesis
MSRLVVDLLIPAFNEASTLPGVLAGIPRGAVRHVYVVDNGSNDDTARTAAAHGAIVLEEPRRGYGAACRCGVAHVAAGDDPPDVLVFMHADGSDDPEAIPALVRPIEQQRLDLVIGSRKLGKTDPGSVRFADRVSRTFAVALIHAIYGQRYTDLGAFRAIRLPALIALGMVDDGPGWNVEMQVKAVKAALRVAEVPVRRRRRALGPAREHTITERARSSSRMLYTILRHSTSR